MPYLLLILVLLPFLSKANNHIVMPFASYHLKQKSLLGFGLSYQYQYSESFEFDAGIMQSGDLEVLQEKTKISGRYTSLFLGTNFLKPYNNDLTIKAGLGLTYTIASNNHQLLVDNEIAPYIKLSAKYKISPNLDIEFGQSTQFNSNQISSNHNVFLGIAWSFGASKYLRLNKKEPTEIYEQKQKIVNTIKNVEQPAAIENKHTSITNLSTLSTTATQWYIQLAAYKNIEGAKNKLLYLQQLFLRKEIDVQLKVININGASKLIISEPFSDKLQAQTFAKYIHKLFSMEVFVTTFKKPNIIND